jgi:mannose-6-phosphate isomerase-like protein (cupin superfamily)
MVDFVVREWHLQPFDGDQAPAHVHHEGEEAFICLEGDLEVLIGTTRRQVRPGEHVVVPRGSSHTFASRTGAHVLAVMSPEIAELIEGLHAPMSDQERAALWARFRSEVVQ